jgi:hypothetical protein
MRPGTFAVTRATTVGRLQKKIDGLRADATRTHCVHARPLRARRPAGMFFIAIDPELLLDSESVPVTTKTA